MKSIKIRKGDRFGRWTVLREVDGHNAHRMVECRCDCGTTKVRGLNSIRRGASQSCGCLLKEVITKHGMHHTPEYSTWAHMIYRCSRKRKKEYSWRNYGGRGISVCAKWKASFTDFLADVGTRPSSLHSLERINNDGDYEPSNVRWATIEE